MKSLEKPMSFQEVMDFLDRGSTWLYGELQSGRMPGYKLGGRWIVYPSDLQKYLERQRSNQRKIRLVR